MRDARLGIEEAEMNLCMPVEATSTDRIMEMTGSLVSSVGIA